MWVAAVKQLFREKESVKKCFQSIGDNIIVHEFEIKLSNIRTFFQLAQNRLLILLNGQIEGEQIQDFGRKVTMVL